jgi:predicted GNAT family N-acyltransferase
MPSVCMSTAPVASRDDHSRLDFIPVRDPGHIAAYHDIRRLELFARYDPAIRYLPSIANEDAPNHLGHVLLRDQEVVGTMRIDLLDRTRAGFRLVAVKGAYKNRGFGAVMMERSEALVVAYGRCSVVINAARPAADFYRRHGYSEGDWTDVRPYDPITQVRLGKWLAPRP